MYANTISEIGDGVLSWPGQPIQLVDRGLPK